MTNLGNPQETSLLELAETIRRLLNAGSTLDFRPLPVDPPKRHCPDITRAGTIPSWEPSVSNDAGLAKTVAFFQEKLNLQNGEKKNHEKKD